MGVPPNYVAKLVGHSIKTMERHYENIQLKNLEPELVEVRKKKLEEADFQTYDLELGWTSDLDPNPDSPLAAPRRVSGGDGTDDGCLTTDDGLDRSWYLIFSQPHQVDQTSTGSILSQRIFSQIDRWIGTSGMLYSDQ